MVAALWLLVLASRFFGPNDLWDKEQPRTIAYTVDMLQHGNFILPHDAFGIPATKPPLYNWVSLPFNAAFGYADFVHRIPALLSSLAVILTLFLYGKSLQPHLEGGTTPSRWTLGAIASAMWLATPLTMRLSYVARPDMPLVALLTGAWAAASVMIQSPRSRPAIAAVFWLCTLGAALDKGPLALFALAYLVIAALLLRKPRALLHCGWWWGLPVLLLGSGLWTYAAYQREPEYITKVLFGHEVGMRFDLSESARTFINSPLYPITGLFPWSLLVLGVLWAIGPRKWFSHPLAPAIIWLLLITLGMALAAHRRRDWYAPVYPQMALLAAAVVLGLIERTRTRRFLVRPLHAFLLATLAMVAFAAVDWTTSTYATTKWGDNSLAFARELRKTVGNDPVLFLDGERTGIQSLLGIQQPTPPLPEFLANVRWCVKASDLGTAAGYFPIDPSTTILAQSPVLISQPIYDGEEDVIIDGKQQHKQYRLKLALYRLEPGQAAAEYALHQQIPIRYDNNEGMSHSPDGTVRKYARFWRQFQPVVALPAPARDFGN